MTDGSSQPFTVPGQDVSLVSAGNWTDRGTQLVVRFSYGEIKLIDGASGTVTTVLSAEQVEVSGFATAEDLTWSRDGRKVALSTYRVCFTCDHSQSSLPVFDLDTKRTVTAAVINPGIGSLAFAPDGRRIAYVAEPSRQIYVANVP